MGSRRHDRFVQANLPSGSQGPSPDLRRLEHQNTHDEALDFFKKEIKTSTKLRKACNEAEHLLNCGTVGKSLGYLSHLDHHSKVAIVAYSLQSPNIYLDFNERSRNLSPETWEDFPYKGMWLLLNKAILTHGNLSQTVTVYRGIDQKINLSHSEFCFRQITSTSKDAICAEDFKGEYGTVFILEISRGLYIKPLSLYGYEEEYLLPAFDLFVVKKVEDTPTCRKIYLRAKYGPCQASSSSSGSSQSSNSSDTWCQIQ